jgi:hypothetical protein
VRKYNISSDLVQVKSFLPIVYKQYDNGDNLEVELFEDGDKINLTNEIVLAFFELENGTVIQKTCTVNENGNAVATLDNNVLSVGGKLKAEFTVYKDGKETTTRTIQITVESSINRNEAIETIPQWDIVHQVLDLKASDGTAIEEKINVLNEAVEVKFNELAAAAQVDSEVVLARGNEDNLKARLDKTDVSLADMTTKKADQLSLDSTNQELQNALQILANAVKKSDTGILNLNVFDENTRAVLQGLQPGQINAVLGVKNVTPINTTFFKTGKNLFNKNTATSGRYVDASNGNLSGNGSYYASDYIKVDPNTAYYLQKNTGHNAFYDSAKTYISGFATATFTTPANCSYVRVSVLTADLNTMQLELGSVATSYEVYEEYLDSSFLKTLSIPDDKITGITASKLVGQISKSQVDFIALGKNLFDKSTIAAGKYVDPNTGGRPNHADYDTSDYVPLLPNTDYVMTTAYKMAFYDSNKIFISGIDIPITTNYTFKTPLNTAYGRFTIIPSVLETTQIEKGTTSTSFEPFGYSLSGITLKSNPITQNIKNGVRHTFDINSNDFIGVDDYQNMCAYSITFRADITTFNGIKLGKGYQAYMGGTLEVDNTNVKVYEGANTTPYQTYPHGLTFADYISVTIEMKYGNVASVKVCTNGGEYGIAFTSWDVRKGVLFLKSVGTNILTNCNLSYYCYGLEKPTYIYGDSYLTNAAGVTDRWPSYLLKGNHTNFMLNGYSGRASLNALKALKLDLTLGIPKRIIWCLGMNDADTAGAINANWKSCVEELKSICEQNNIELILATIPLVNAVGNVKKNEYVRASGYRYIDFAKAVGASSDYTWYTNMLSDDGVHTAIEGARASCSQAVADVPELLS